MAPNSPCTKRQVEHPPAFNGSCTASAFCTEKVDAALLDRQVLLERGVTFYERLLRWLVTHYDDMSKAGFLNLWRGYTTKEKAILLELIWMSVLQASRILHNIHQPPPPITLPVISPFLLLLACAPFIENPFLCARRPLSLIESQPPTPNPHPPLRAVRKLLRSCTRSMLVLRDRPPRPAHFLSWLYSDLLIFVDHPPLCAPHAQ